MYIGGIAGLVLTGLLFCFSIISRRRVKGSLELMPKLAAVEQNVIRDITIDNNELTPKKQIEKFLNKKPEDVAQLIKSWLNEE